MAEVKCFVCGTTEKDKVYMPCIEKGEKKYACVRCLPVLIHGQH